MLLLIILSGFFLAATANIDSVKVYKLESKMKILEDQLSEVRRDQLNYSIEKNIIKDVYSNNYERINLTITFVLGLFGVLGFLGIKNVNSIKKDYTNELNEIKALRETFEQKIIVFNALKEKYDEEIKNISQTNTIQNNKIQLLELREKLKKLMKEKEFSLALETVLIALDLSPDDTSLLIDKAMINCRLGSFKDSVKTLKKAIEIEPLNDTIILNLIEAYYFNNQPREAKELIAKHNDIITAAKDGKLLKYLETIDTYHNQDLDALKQIVEEQIDKSDLESKKKRFNWNFDDIHWFHAHVRIPNKDKVLIQYIWYMKGDSTGSEVLKTLNEVS